MAQCYSLAQPLLSASLCSLQLTKLLTSRSFSPRQSSRFSAIPQPQQLLQLVSLQRLPQHQSSRPAPLLSSASSQHHQTRQTAILHVATLSPLHSSAFTSRCSFPSFFSQQLSFLTPSNSLCLPFTLGLPTLWSLFAWITSLSLASLLPYSLQLSALLHALHPAFASLPSVRLYTVHGCSLCMTHAWLTLPLPLDLFLPLPSFSASVMLQPQPFLLCILGNSLLSPLQPHLSKLFPANFRFSSSCFHFQLSASSSLFG